jgi:transposase
MNPEQSKKQAAVAQLTAEVLRLSLFEGKSVRAIAKKLSVSRNTVRRMLGRGPSAARRVVSVPRPSLLVSYQPFVKKTLDDEPDIKAPGMLERLRPIGYTGGITIVRDLLHRLREGQQRREAFLTLHFQPGAAAQVDWADFGFAIPGVPRRVSAFIMVLCYSRYLYVEFTLSQAFGSFVRAMERGLRFFGGATHTDIFDNMRTVVLTHTPTVTVFNPRCLAYAAARGFAVRACRPRKPHEKGRVERPVGFIRSRFWPGRRFTSLLDLNRQAVHWRDDFANNREHEETGKIPALVFKHEEQPLLKALPATPFDTDDIDATGVTRLFRVRFDRNTYSVPSRLVSQSVIVRANDELVSVFLGPKQVALHQRSWNIGEDIELPAHRDAAIADKPRAAAGGLPPGLTALGDLGRDYFKVFAAGNRSIHKETIRLTQLCELFGDSGTAAAMDEVMKTGHVGAEYVEYVLRYKKGLTPSAPPLRLGDPQLDAISLREPDLSRYDPPGAYQKTLDPGEPTPSPPDDTTPDNPDEK